MGDPTVVSIVQKLRLPRAILAALVGGSLAASGAAFQALLRNPLAEPFILGVSGGAAVGAATAIVVTGALASSGIVTSSSLGVPCSIATPVMASAPSTASSPGGAPSRWPPSCSGCEE